MNIKNKNLISDRLLKLYNQVMPFQSFFHWDCNSIQDFHSYWELWASEYFFKSSFRTLNFLVRSVNVQEYWVRNFNSILIMLWSTEIKLKFENSLHAKEVRTRHRAHKGHLPCRVDQQQPPERRQLSGQVQNLPGHQPSRPVSSWPSFAKSCKENIVPSSKQSYPFSKQNHNKTTKKQNLNLNKTQQNKTVVSLL